MTVDLEHELAAGLGAMFRVSRHGDLVRIRTPFWYPDGGVIDVFARVREGAGELITLTDLGEATGWLRTQMLGTKRSPKQQRLVQDVCSTLGVELFKGQLMLRCPDAASFPQALMRLGQAVVRVADLWFTTRTRSVESVADEVDDFLGERGIARERSVKLAGRSGRDWMVDFQTRTSQNSALVYVLASGSRAAARRVSEHVVAAWHDLNPIRTGLQPVRFVSLFDDSGDVWGDDDFRLLESVSEVCRWSEPAEFERVVRDAA